jgi:hypothetical protein
MGVARKLKFKEKTRVISFRGVRNLWLKFSHKCKMEEKEIWEVLSGFLKEYLKK